MQPKDEGKKKKPTCSYCGNSPVPHLHTFFFQCFALLLSTVDYSLRNVLLYRFFVRLCEELGLLVGVVALRLGIALRLVTCNSEPTRALSYRSQVVWEEARERGIPMEQIIVGSIRTDIYRAFVNKKWHIFISVPTPPWIPPPRMWIDDKFFLKKYLRAHGIPVPNFEALWGSRSITNALKELHYPLVVKPRLGSRGRHTTTHVRNEEDARRAFRVARVLCPQVSIEEQLEGSVCRGTVIGGKLEGFLEARAPYIIGDGVQTIVQLVAQKNALRPERVSEIILTPEVDRYLASIGFSQESVPLQDEKVTLTYRTGRLFGGETREILTTVHPRLREYLEEAARVLNIAVVGFDLIIKNPESDPDIQKWGIIEANTLPFIDLHYLPLQGTPSKTAKAVWDLWNIQPVTK